MNAYFINVSKEERENILDKHKSVYDGYVTNYVQPNQQQLYVQDFANDKNGITISNKGTIKPYTHMNINEGLDFDDSEIEEMHDMIGDGHNDLEHGTFSDEDDEIIDFEDIDSIDFEELDLNEIEPVMEQINKNLDMFRRFKNY